MRILSTKWFSKWFKKCSLESFDLLEAINNMEDGLSSSGLGKHLFKIRVKKKHSGKSSEFRTIVAYKEDDKAIFIYEFEKNERENIDDSELKYFQRLGDDLLALDENQLKQFLEQKILFDIEVSK